MASKKILTCRFARPEADVRLICFPWAGGGSIFYSNWGKTFPSSIEVHGVCLAGREMRYKDEQYKNLNSLLEDVTDAIHDQCKDKPFALWGHSMGALLTYETACLLKSRYNMEPVYMFVSGTSAPHSAKRKETTLDVSKKTDEEFIQLLKHFGGTPADILDNPDFLKLFIPPLRADYELLPSFSYEHPKDRCVFNCPVDVFDGKADVPHDLDAWGDITTGKCSVTKLAGGHFYLKEEANSKKLCEYISHALHQ